MREKELAYVNELWDEAGLNSPRVVCCRPVPGTATAGITRRACPITKALPLLQKAGGGGLIHCMFAAG